MKKFWSEHLERRTLLSAITIADEYNFVRTTWNLYSLSDDATNNTFSQSDGAVSYKDLVDAFIEAPGIIAPLLGGDYGTAASHALDYGETLAGNYALATLGLTGVAAIAKLATYPITAGLNNIYQVVNQAAFNSQAALYIQARTDGVSAAEIAADSQQHQTQLLSAGAVAVDENGWLFGQLNGHEVMASPLTNITPIQFFAEVETEYTVISTQTALANDSTEVEQDFAAAATPGVPVITQQPQSQSINGGATATFSVQATGTGTLQYQWQLNNANLSGQTNSTLSASQAGSYDVIVTSSAGSTTSNTATLIVNSGPPVIVVQPQSQSVQAGWSATFSVQASGTAPLSYQWMVNNTPISGATGAAVTVAATNAGNIYTVQVSNSLGSIVSSAASLVLQPPSVDTWTGAVSSDWFNYGNWSSGHVPGASDIVTINGGSVNVSSAVSVGTLNFSSGQLSGSLNLTGTMNWTGGSLGGTLTVASGSTLNITGGTVWPDATLNNAGTINQPATLIMSGYNLYNGGWTYHPATINNLAGAVYNLQDGGFTSANAGGPFNDTINNAGTFEKTAGTGIAQIDVNSSNITFNNTGTVSVAAGTLQIAGTIGPLSQSSLTAGTWIAENGGRLSLSQSFSTIGSTASVVLDGLGSSITSLAAVSDIEGTLAILDGASLTITGGIVGNGDTDVGPGSSFTTLFIRQSLLTVGGTIIIGPNATQLSGSGRLNVVGSLLVTSGGKFDVSRSDLVVTAGTLPAVSALVGGGYASGAWTGTGITSSAAATDSTHLTALGVIANTSNGTTPLYGSGTTLGLFDGYNPAANAVLVKYTYYGDANLDGRVDGSDYTLIDNGFNNHLTGWYNGDFNYDGVVNGSDYTLIDNAFNTQGASLAAQIAPVSRASTRTTPAVRLTSRSAAVFSQSLISQGVTSTNEFSATANVAAELFATDSSDFLKRSKSSLRKNAIT